MTGKADIMNRPEAGGLGGTYAGSPVACAAALAAIGVIEEEGLAERATVIGEQIVARIRDLQKNTKCIGDVRNLGAMVSMELIKDGDASRPDADLTKALVQESARRGLVLLPCGVRGNVIRYLVPLTAADELISEGMDIVAAGLAELTS